MPAIAPTKKVSRKRLIINPGVKLKESSFDEIVLNHGRISQTIKSAITVAAKVWITASVINKFKESVKIYSKTNRPLNNLLIVKANKNIDYKNKLELASKKQFKIEKLVNIQSNKIFVINKNLLISGKKITNFRTNKIIKAKKDILPILIATGLIGENDERM